MNAMNVLLVSGGSGGHLVPAMALAEHLQPEDRCVLMSTRRPVDRLLAAEAASAVEWETIGLQPFTPLWKWLSPLYLARQLRAAGRVRSVIEKAKPDVVVGFGGYLSAVGVVTARGAGIPSVIHEQNLLPGRANRLLARLADAVAVSFPETKSHLPRRAAVETTGNPIRLQRGGMTAEQARATLGLDREKPVLLVMGGSQGSRAINRLALAVWEAAPAKYKEEIQLLHLAGTEEAATEAGEAYRRLGVRAAVFPFLGRMDLALASATLAVCRAGATGIAELTAMELPSILIPYPYAGAHQRANAEWARGAGGAILLEEKGLTAERLWREVERLLSDPARLAGMRRALRDRSDGQAAQRLGELVRRVFILRQAQDERMEMR